MTTVNVGSILTVDVATWQNQYPSGDYPVQRRHQWRKDGVDIPGAIGLAYTPSEPGEYTVVETAYFLQTGTGVFVDGPDAPSTSDPITVIGARQADLVYQSDLEYLGAFQFPDTPGAPSEFESFAFGGYGLTFNPAGNSGAGSLFAFGCVNGPVDLVGEFSIPLQNTWQVGSIGSAPKATLLSGGGQTLTQALENAPLALDGGVKGMGLAVNNGKLLMAITTPYTYDGASWIWTRPLNLSTTGSVKGPFAVTDKIYWDNPRAFCGYLAPVPLSLQSKLGGPFLLGNVTQSIVSSTADGPVTASIDPDNFTALESSVFTGTVGATNLSGTTIQIVGGSNTPNAYVGMWLKAVDRYATVITAYNSTTKVATVDNFLNGGAPNSPPAVGSTYTIIPHVPAKALGFWQTNEFQNWQVGNSAPANGGDPFFPTIWDTCSDEIHTVVIDGTRSVLVFAAGGNGMYRYGIGSGGDVNNGEIISGVRVYDPTNTSRGEHSYPYTIRCWAFNADELEQSRLGNVLPKDVKPYAVFNFNLPAPFDDRFSAKGVAYDPETKRLFISVGSSFPGGRPGVHVYSIANAE